MLIEDSLLDLSGAAQGIGAVGADGQDHELVDFVAWSVGIQIAGGLLGAVTFGAGEGAAQAGEAGEIANAASKVIGILRDLAELARAVATTIGGVLARIAELLPKIKLLLVGGKDAAEVEAAGHPDRCRPRPPQPVGVVICGGRSGPRMTPVTASVAACAATPTRA